MHSLHLQINLLPILLFLLATIYELILKPWILKNETATFALIYLACASTLLAFATGYFSAHEDIAISLHYNLAKLCIFLQIPLLIFVHLKEENKYTAVIFYTCLLANLGVICYTTYIGYNSQ